MISSFTKLKGYELKFIWNKTDIYIPYGADVNKYINDYEVKFYVDGIESQDFYVEKEVNYSTFDTVITTKVGDYRVYYKAISETYNFSSVGTIVFHVFDNISPKISPTTEEIYLEYEEKLTDFTWLRAIDNVSSFESLRYILDDSLVKYNTLGKYPAKISIYDEFDNCTEYDFYINIYDKTKPVIKNLLPLKIEYGENIEIANYFIATDNYDGDVTQNIIIDGYNPYLIGNYYIDVSVFDSSNNKTTMKFMINVIDSIPPTVILKSTELLLDLNKISTYDEQFFLDNIIQAYDNASKKLDIYVDYRNIKHEIRDFIVIYQVKDESQNINTIEVLVKVREVIPPIINGPDYYKINVNDSIDLYSLIIVDANLKDKVEIIENNLDVTKVGTYKVIYRVFNSSGLYSIKEIIIEVTNAKIDETPMINYPTKEEFINDNKVNFFNKEVIFLIVIIGQFLFSSFIIIYILKKKK